ncbi:MAG: hypothetical protein NC311_00160 [Muribaculaceae bacterium]|nr:hypothetical protein [Muribaculaceae bacterium]
MRYAFVFTILLISSNAIADTAELSIAINNVQTACSGISDNINHLSTMAGINTAITSVGTVAGGVALGTGIAKNNVDKDIEKLEQEIADLQRLQEEQGIWPDYIDISDDELNLLLADNTTDNSQPNNESLAILESKQQQLDQTVAKSKQLGNIRTGTLATATATDITGAVIAGTNRVNGDLQSQINNCIASVKILHNVRMQARLDANADSAQLDHAEQIEANCGQWQYVDISSINTKATGATISSAVGAAMGLTGTITSAMANSDGIRNNNTESGKSKEKNLNNTANIMAGGTTVTSGIATIFNATQISAIKKALTVAKECEKDL